MDENMKATKKSENTISHQGRLGIKKNELALHILIPFLVVSSMVLQYFARLFNLDSDHIWSLAVGRWISQNGTVPFVDIFSWTVPGKEWFSNSWFFCWLLYKADLYVGYFGPALIIFVSYMITGYFLYAICRRYNPSTFSSLIFAIATFILIYFSVLPRAYIFTLAFLAIIFYLLRFKRESWLIYTIPLIFFLWSNVQSSMKFGIVILIVEALAGTVLFKDKKFGLWPVVALSFLATLMNPYGLNFWDFSPASFIDLGTPYINEWKAVDFSNYLILALYLVLGATGIIGLMRVKKPLEREKLMILFWFWAALIYSLTTVRALHYVLLLWGPCFSAFADQTEKEKKFFKPVVVSLILIVWISSMIYSLPLIPLELNAQGKPVSTVEYLEKQSLEKDYLAKTMPVGAKDFLINNPQLQKNLFNSYNFGGYLLYNDMKVFIDARESVFTQNNVMEDYMNLTELSAPPEAIIEKYDVRNFVLEKDKPLIYYLNLSPKWEKVFEDNIAVIYSLKE